MKYNLFIKYNVGGFNILDLEEEKLPIITDAYKLGKQKFTISGTEYDWGELKTLKIFRNEASMDSGAIEQYCQENGGLLKVFGAGYLVSPEFLENLGSDVSDDFLGDIPFGGATTITAEKQTMDEYINQERIKSLQTIKSQSFDMTKLVILCNELNSNWAMGNYYTVGLLLRTIVNYVPPIFDHTFTSFGQVVANYGSQSFKKNMGHLNVSLRSIADSYTHDLIRKKEILPNQQQVEFRASLDFLLSEVLRILNIE